MTKWLKLVQKDVSNIICLKLEIEDPNHPSSYLPCHDDNKRGKDRKSKHRVIVHVS